MEIHGLQQVMRSICAAVLTFSLILTPALYAQDAPPPPSDDQSTPPSNDSEKPAEPTKNTKKGKKTGRKWTKDPEKAANKREELNKARSHWRPKISPSGKLPGVMQLPEAMKALDEFVRKALSNQQSIETLHPKESIFVFSPPADALNPLEGVPLVRPVEAYSDALNVPIPSAEELVKGALVVTTGVTLAEFFTLLGSRLVCLFVVSQQMLDEFLHLNRPTCSNDSDDTTESCSVELNGKNYQFTCQDSEENPEFAICSFEPVRS